MEQKKKNLVVVSLIKQAALGEEKIRVSADAIAVLSDRVEKILSRARATAKEDGRKTILARDIPE